MRDCIKKAKIYSKYSSPILILGKSGTGKELFAQSIHNSSDRSSAPFVAINCAAIPKDLVESELFGYAEGAFTSAVKGGKAGVFELAHRGTIFLDEIGEMPIGVQTRLLRVIQEKQVMRIGDDKLIPIDVRIIAATNKDLNKMVNEGKFREDLYYRINILTLLVPSLNDRNEDIIQLSRFFIDKYAMRYNKKIQRISMEAKDYLENHYYKGNIRELQGMIERAVVLCQENVLKLEDVRLLEEIEYADHNVIGNKKDSNTEKMEAKSLKQVEDEYIKKVMDACSGNVSKASKVLKISRTTLWRKMNNDA
jgi:transcriptional regulator with PAS, ATPase and Fis domain